MSFSNKFYLDQKFFDFEEDVFQKEAWLLVAHKTELSNSNDFIAFDYFGEKIFIQNFKSRNQ
jgi:phenylpropionate dioxygenase-like ring-hydroxylating dioxygenase large terminal subunit